MTHSFLDQTPEPYEEWSKAEETLAERRKRGSVWNSLNKKLPENMAQNGTALIVIRLSVVGVVYINKKRKMLPKPLGQRLKKEVASGMPSSFNKDQTSSSVFGGSLDS